MQEIGIEPNISQISNISISITMYYLVSTDSPMRSYKMQRASTLTAMSIKQRHNAI